MSGGDGDAAELTYSAWTVALLPTYLLLGFALPISFLTSVGQLLYYLRPFELLPTYGTAWLFTAVLSFPLSGIGGLIVHSLDRRRRLRGVRTMLVAVLVSAAAVILVAAFANGFVVWLRTFGLLSQIHVFVPLSLVCVLGGALIGTMRAGRRVLLELYSPAKIAMILGGLSVLSLPFSGWGGGALASRSLPPLTPASGTRPNILLVTIDTLSAEHMSLYGAPRPTTPNLDAFARDATVFDRAYSNGNFTTPGIASILTGTRPWTHRALQLPAWPDADARANSMPALLQRAGYQTAYVGTGPWAGAARNGMDAYFDSRTPDADANNTLCRDRISAVFPYDCAVTTQLAPFFVVSRLIAFVWEAAFDRPPNWEFDPRRAIRPALAWLAHADKRAPIFLWVHFLPPHSPYAAPAPWLGTYDSSNVARSVANSESEDAYLFRLVSEARARVLEARYDEAVNYVDHFVGEYLSSSMRLLGDNTVVIVTADHGESFGHGYGKHTGPGLFESIIHVPLIVKFPHQEQGTRSPVVAEQVDIAPTIAELAGLPRDPTWEGRSLADAYRSPAAYASTAAAPAYAMNFEENVRRSALTTGSVAVIDGPWKLVQYFGPLHYRLMPALHDELYDLSADPDEHANRISDHPDEAARLRGLIAAQLARHGGARP
jgi:arylsulfatase A-like enzyme